MKNNSKHIRLEDLDDKSKKNNFRIPKNYYSSLKNNIKNIIEEDSESVLPRESKNNNFDVPANYHSALKAKLEKDLLKKSVTPKKKNIRTMYYVLGSIAAIFIGLILINMPSANVDVARVDSSSVSISIDEFQKSLIEEVENFDPLIAMVSEEENESEYDYLFAQENKEVTTVADIQDLFIDEWEDSEYDY